MHRSEAVAERRRCLRAPQLVTGIARLYADCRHETPTAPLYRVSAPGEPPPRRRAEASQPGPAQEAPPARLLPPALCAAPLQGALPLSPGGTGASFIMGFSVF
ncbi:hypothetical protein AV530_009163 [Patagioenas fasciata monilis]|uniref:Uncharacterized protein n=1 Tax=Patagioenas fasciata monilis TaxID=372326 RepID=A0A1V4IWC5_PATFA|nr:hypothetical protein AV530_009163 [Patagioenas fasciata monilis]